MIEKARTDQQQLVAEILEPTKAIKVSKAKKPMSKKTAPKKPMSKKQTDKKNISVNEETTIQNGVDGEKIWKAVEDLRTLVINMSKDKSCNHNKERLESESKTNETINASKGKQLITDHFSSSEASHQKTKDKENKRFKTDYFKPVNRTVNYANTKEQAKEFVDLKNRLERLERDNDNLKKQLQEITEENNALRKQKSSEIIQEPTQNDRCEKKSDEPRKMENSGQSKDVVRDQGNVQNKTLVIICRRTHGRGTNRLDDVQKE